jgi:hypothetical protein
MQIAFVGSPAPELPDDRRLLEWNNYCRDTVRATVNSPEQIVCRRRHREQLAMALSDENLLRRVGRALSFCG